MQFFALLLLLLVSPFVVSKFIWLIGSKKVKGTVDFTGHSGLGSSLGLTNYPVISFSNGKDIVTFNGHKNSPLKKGEEVEIRFQIKNPTNARINDFVGIWGDTVVYCLWPFTVILIFFIVPDIVPIKSRIKLGLRPFIRILESNS